ncbi:hypothetical protein O181_004970 [Austropuccinia psidii MF-1]|uniref:Uncharacterized protein n=1 Tax=Austropuccinia psidii MF-1 TaxID=1389203 RepID=A0A9Q3BI26_9BASI|nr:hypothetical protein [Austropuccinia psidii MF-1]
MSKFIIDRNILRQCGGYLEYSAKSRTTEQSSEEDTINILEEVTTRTKIVYSRIDLKTRLNTPWKDYVDRTPKGNPTNMKYKPEEMIGRCHICQSTTRLAKKCPKRGKINEINV